MQGYLHKRSEILKIWKIRYFVLEHSFLSYSKRSGIPFKRKYSIEQIKQINENCVIQHGENYVFMLIFDDRLVYLSASTQESRNEWIQAFRQQGQSSLILNSQKSSLDVRPSTLKFSFRKKLFTNAKKKERKRLVPPKLKKSISKIWLEDILPFWKDIEKKNIEWLCWLGIPKDLRGVVWSALLGDKLQINAELYEIYVKRSKCLFNDISRLKEDSNSINQAKNEEVKEVEVGNDIGFIADREHTMLLISQDIPRTFGSHPSLQEGDRAHQVEQVLRAYICYRPDLGYVQGMSYLAATFVVHMNAFDAFKNLSELISKKLLFDLYRLEENMVGRYIQLFDHLLGEELQDLKRYFDSEGLHSNMYIVDWALSLFTRSIPMECACRLWDCFLLFGSSFFFQAALGLLKMHQDALFKLDLAGLMKFLHHFPKDLDMDVLFECISLISISREAINDLLGQQCVVSTGSTVTTSIS